MCKLFDTIVLMYGERSNLSWGNWENPVPVLQIYMTSAHKSTHNCSNGRTGTILCTTTHPAKSNHILCPRYEFMYIRTKRYYVLLRTEWLHPLYCYPQSAFDLACNVLGNGSGRYRSMRLGISNSTYWYQEPTIIILWQFLNYCNIWFFGHTVAEILVHTISVTT